MNFGAIEIYILFYFMGKHFEKDVWKPLMFCNGKYQVSRFGKIKSIYTLSKYGHIRLTGTILKTQINSKGYEKVDIGFIENGVFVSRKMAVHRLVAMAFIPNTENKPEVNHKDLNPLNNHFLNLEWATSKENTHHAQLNGARPVRTKFYIKKGRATFWKKIVHIHTGEITNSKEISERLGIKRKEIGRQLSGERPNKLPYRYL